MENKKPLGIVLIASSNAFLGVMLVPVGYVTTAFATEVRGAPSYAGWYGFLSLALGLLLLTSACGLWAQRPWGRSFTVWVQMGVVPVSSVGLISLLLGARVSTGNVAASVVGIALALWCIRYLNRDEVRRFYEGRAAAFRPPADPLAAPALS